MGRLARPLNMPVLAAYSHADFICIIRHGDRARLGESRRQLQAHGVTLVEAAGSLLDPMALVCEDESAAGEVRLVLVGMSSEGRLLTVCYTLRGEETIRLISARRATRQEERQYAQGI